MLISSAILFVLSLFVDTTAIVIAVQTPRSLKNIIIDSIAKNGLAVSLSVAPILLTSTASLAVGTSSTLKEKIASSAARIPGFGIPDIFYPDEWQGKWKTIHEISDIVKLTNDLPFLYATLGTKMSYEYISNFIEHNDNTVLDRASTAAAKAAKFTNTYALAFWEASNPNILKIDFDNGQVWLFFIVGRLF